MPSVSQTIATELVVDAWKVEAAIELLDGGATVPFVARYRKEATGGLDDAQLRTLEERLSYLRELSDRRKAIVESITEQGAMTDALLVAIMSVATKAELEDIYLPYRPKRRTKADAAREAGLEPLAMGLLADPSRSPEDVAAAYVDEGKNVADVAAALDGAKAILVETFAENAQLVGRLRQTVWDKGEVATRLREEKKLDPEAQRFSDYFERNEPLSKAPHHRILAMFRGEKEGFLTIEIAPSAEIDHEAIVARAVGVADRGRPGDKWLAGVVRSTWRARIQLGIDIDIRTQLWQAAEEAAVKVFAGNLRDLLLAAPAGARRTLALDPGFRAGVKCAAIDETGKVLETVTVYPHEPQRRWDDARRELASVCRRHRIDILAVGNGTASRETEKLAAEIIAMQPELKMTKAVVSEAGASVYSASAIASAEFPNLDVSLRGAVSIARRLQDPLAELVKIDPKSIGVGQYQHDLSEFRLSTALDAVVEDCVNAVGVNLNQASAPLLARVSGIGESLAESIVAWRDANGGFRTRADLMKVSRLGPKTFEQCAGFLRITDGDDPLDRTGVHPEAYPVVRRILEATKADIKVLMGDAASVRRIKPQGFVDESFGLPTVTDILKELEKPGRDPRPSFKTATFQEGVEKISDLKPGMILEGTVTNCAAFGAFVDIGVHQDGLVHISALADRRVNDVRDVVRPGQVVKVKVLEVDAARKRISLTMRMNDALPVAGEERGRPARQDQNSRYKPAPAAPSGAFAAAFERAQKR